MSTATTVESAERLWSEEAAKRPGRRRIRTHIGGLHCSLCTGTIEKALGKRPGVDKVAVSLTHEQALIEYNNGHEGCPIPGAGRAIRARGWKRRYSTPTRKRSRYRGPESTSIVMSTLSPVCFDAA